MGLEAPVRRAIHAARSESGEAQLVLTAGDILDRGLEGGEVSDVLLLVSGLGEELLVVDQAVGLDNVGNALDLAVIAFEREGIRGQRLENVGVIKVVAVIFPGREANGTVDLEQRGRLGLGHLGLQRGLVLAGCSGLHGYGNARLLRICFRELLPLGVLLGLEVEVIDLALGIVGRTRARGRTATATAARKSEATHNTEASCNERTTIQHLYNLLCRPSSNWMETFPNVAIYYVLKNWKPFQHPFAA